MKMFIVVIVLVLVFLVGWYFINESIGQYTTNFVNQLNHISKTIKDEDWNMVTIEYKRIKDNWNKIRDLLSILLDHHEIDNIDLSMAKAHQYIETKNAPLSLAEIEVLRQLFIIIDESESLTITNIL